MQPVFLCFFFMSIRLVKVEFQKKSMEIIHYLQLCKNVKNTNLEQYIPKFIYLSLPNLSNLSIRVSSLHLHFNRQSIEYPNPISKGNKRAV